MASKLREMGSHAFGRVADENDWGGHNPAFVKPERWAGGTVNRIFPAAPNVVGIITPGGEALCIRTR